MNSFKDFFRDVAHLKMSQDISLDLTENEAAVLGAFGIKAEVYIPEVAVAAKLSPYDTEVALNGLLRKKLLKHIKRGIFVGLTPRGMKAQNYVTEIYLAHKKKSESISNIDLALEKAIQGLPEN
jgi:hypothetical protein